MIAEVDEEGTGAIDLDGFIRLMSRKILVEDVEDELKEAFRIFSNNDDGTITVSALRRIVANLASQLSEGEVDEIIRLYDDGTGKINFDVFTTLMQGATKAKIKPGQIGLVMGCGPIGLVTALAALAGGCAKVYIADILSEKLKMCDYYPDLIPIDISKENLETKIMDETNGWGVDRFFECSGAVKAYEAIFTCCSPGAHVVLIGNNAEPVPMNWAILFSKGLEFQTVHRYSHQYEPSIRLLERGKIDVKPMITHTFKFEESVEAFLRAAEHRPTDVKLQIKIDE